jgi:hypothetical protein
MQRHNLTDPHLFKHRFETGFEYGYIFYFYASMSHTPNLAQAIISIPIFKYN